jgi:hypothetical protein
VAPWWQEMFSTYMNLMLQLVGRTELSPPLVQVGSPHSHMGFLFGNHAAASRNLDVQNKTSTN